VSGRASLTGGERSGAGNSIPSAGHSVASAGHSAGRAVITVYSTPDCHLCAEALERLRALRTELGFELCERDIDQDEALHRAYFERIPVIALDGEELFDYVLDEQILRERLESRT
jgi:glutaredoxin